MYNEFNVFSQGNSYLDFQYSLLEQSLFPSPERLGGLPSVLLGVEKLEIPALTPTTLPPNFVINSSFPGLHSLVDPLLGTSLVVHTEAINDALLQVGQSFDDFLQKPNHIDSLQVAFGSGWQLQTATALITDLAQGQNLPAIEVVTGQELKAQGAFSQQTNTIYLAQEFVEQNPTNAIAKVLTEELGHYIDSQLNPVDTPGDEGELFAAIVDGTELTPGQLQAIKAEDDHKIVTINGQTLLVEQSINAIIGTPGRDVLTGTPLSDRIIGGVGADLITGGLGADVFVYQNIRDAGDIIKDFELRQDVIDVSQVLSSFGYQGLNPIADGYIKFSTYTDGTIILLDSDGMGSLSARPYIYVEKVTPNDLSSYPSHFIPNPGEPPQIQAGLVNDTGASNSDRLTFDPRISGRVTATSNLISLKAGLNNQAVTVDIFDTLQPDGSFNLTTARLRQINGGSLNDGAYTLKLQATDNKGNISSVYSFNFVLDTTAPILNLQLDPNFDSAPVGDLQTTFETVNLVGATEANLTVNLQQTGVSSTSNNLGQFTFANISLIPGSNLFTVSAKDLAGNQGEFSQTFQRFVQPINTAPTNLSLNPASSAENVPDNNIIGTFTTTDLDVGDTHTYSLVTGEGDTDNTAFVIVDNQLRIKQSPDFETKSAYSVRVRTTDASGLFLDKIFSISITNVNEAPTALQLSNGAIAENLLANSIIGTFSSIDPDIGEIHSYSLIDGEGGTDNTSFTINGNELRINESADFETKSEYSIRVQTTDASGFSYTQVFNIRITNVNEAPTDILLDGDTVEENADGAVIGTISVIDPDTISAFINNTVTVNDDRFEVVNNNGSLQLKLKDGRSLNYEVETTIPLTLTATDVSDSSLTYSKNFTINVTDVNENVQLPTLSAFVVNDTGVSNSDRLTQDPTVSGQTTDAATLQGNLNGNGFVDISDALNEDGSFTISLEQYDILSNGALPDGDYTLELKANSISGQESEIITISFTLDLTPPPVTFGLAPGSDTGVLGDRITSDRFVTLVGQTQPGLTVALLETQQTTTADSQGNFSFTNVPMPVAGQAPVTIVAVDAAGNQGRSQQFLTREGINGAPEITSTPENIFDTANQSIYTYQIVAIDPDGDDLTYTLLNTPQGAEIDENGLLSFTPSGTLRSSYNFSVEVSDGRGGTDSQNFTVELPTVIENRPPLFTSEPIIVGNIGTEYTYQPTATDPDGDSLTFSLIEAPDGLTIEAETGLLVWTPIANQLGENLVTIQVSDEAGLTNTQSFTIAIQERATNNAPIFISDPVTNFAVAVPNTATGQVNPELVSLSLANGETAIRPVSIQLPSGGTSTGGQADIVFVVDESGSMSEEHEWLTDMVLELDAALQQRGITDSRYSLIGYTSQTRIFNLAAATQVSVYGPGNQLVGSGSFEAIINNPQLEFNLLADGNYTVVISPVGASALPIEYNLNADITNLPEIALTNFNTPFTGNVAPQGQETFTFNAPAGTQIFFDGLSSSAVNDIRARLVDPNGNNIFSNVRLNLDTNPYLLSQGGTYSLIVSGGTTGGNFSFQILEFNSKATEIALDTQISGTISPGLATEVFQFSATQGQTIYFDSAANQSITAAVYSSDNGLLGSRTLLRDFTLNVPSNGTYTLVLQSDSNNPVNYNFRLVTPQTQQVNLAIGDIVTGNLGGSGEKDIYLLEGNAGQRIWFDGLSADSSSIVARLVSPTGVEVFGNTRSDRNSVPLVLPESGIYSLVVTGADQIGNYSFQLIDVLTNATDITSEVASSTQINTRFDTGLQTKVYTFAGTKGQKLAFDAISTSVSGTWQLYGEDNARLAQTNISSDFTVVLPADGTYTLLLDGSNGSPFNLTFQVSEQVIEESTITLGDPVSGTLANSSEQDIYRFSGNAGQRIWFDGLASDSTNIRVSLASSTGQTLFNGLSANNDSEILTLPETGTYYITVNGNNVTGNYNFRVLDITDATSLTLGTDLSNTITPGLGTQLYTFEGNAGQKLLFDMVAVNNSFGGSWLLYGPSSNNFLARNTRLDDFTAVLPTDGTYTLLVDGNSTNPVSYTFNIKDVSTPNNVAPSGFGITRTGNITTPTQEDIFTFEASAGTRILFDGLTSSSSNIRARLIAPDNTQLFSNLQLTNNFDQLILPASGSYSIAVTTTGALGNYSFRVLNLDDAVTLPLDTVFNSSLSIGQRDIYKFTGTAGQQLFFDGISATGSGNWRLYSPENIQLAQSGITNNFTATLPTDGTYFVILDGTSATPVNFSVQVVNVEIQESTLTLGETISGTLTKAGQQDIYRFNASAGQRIFFDGLGSTNLATNARLVSPTGVEILGNTRSDRNSAPLILTESGEYSLIVSAGDRTDNYSFRLLDLDAPTTSINLNTVVSGTVTTALATEVYQFTGNAGQEIFFDALTNTGSLSWTILGSSNADLGNRSFPQDFFTVLPSDGIYTLLLNSSNANPVNFSWEIVTPQRQTATINYGEVITGDLSQPGETDIYQFSGVAGQQIWFDGLESASTEIEVAMVSPGGDRIFERLRLDRDNSTPLTLFESGTYSLIINSGRGNPGAVTGDYRFQVLEITPNLTVPNDLTGTINRANEAQIYQFAGVKGQKLTFTPNDAIFGTAAQISNATQLLSTSQGGTEDGYLGIDKALQLPFRDGAAVNIILVTDEDRDIFNQNLTFDSIFNGLSDQDALLNVVVNAFFRGGSGNTALGVDSQGVAYTADGAGGFISSPGGVFDRPGDASASTVKTDYVDLAWNIGGAAWDLNQLRTGGNTAISFTKAFVDVKATEINEQLAIDLLVTDPNITIENLTGPIFGLNPGETASFDAKITGDGLARSFEIFFVRPETGFVVGSIPVSINQNYLYLAQAVDPDGDALTYSLLNAPTGATINATTGRIDWTPPTTGLYQFEVGVADNRGAQTVQSYQVQVVAAGGDNTAPNITSIAPNTIRVGGNFTYQLTATDAENDPLTFFLAEAPQGVSIDLDTALLSWTPNNNQTGEQTITIKVVDGRGGSDTQSFVIAVNDNQKPVFTSNPIRLGQTNQLYQYDVDASDPEGTTITYSLITGTPDGITINPSTGLIQWQPTTQQAGQFPITVIATDAEGGRSLQSFLVNIGTPDGSGGGDTGGGGTDGEIPTVLLGFSSTVVEIGEDLTLQVQAVDDESIVSLTLQANGTPLNLIPGNIASGAINETTVQFAQAGLIDIIATAEDNDGNVVTRTLTVRVIDPNDKTAPTVALDLSGFDPLNPVITNLTNIVGTISDPSIEFYRVELAPVSLINLNNPAANDPDFITIAEGRGSITDGVLAQIDPSLYRNDSYYIRVYAQDYSGNANVQGVVLGINSQNKPGRFALEFTDLSIPLTGIPIEIQRRYDSLDAKFSGDFGYGWSLGLQDAQIQEAAPTGVDLTRDDFFGGNSFTVGTRVTLTTPDGRRVGFTFNPVPDLAGLLGVRYKPTFTPDAGVYDRLEVDYTPLRVRSDGSVVLYFIGFTYNPSQYRLITKDGTTYRYDQYQGLLDITDRNGNKLTYTDAGIFSSTGQSITFERDAQGRIAEIIDPAGKAILYGYDAKGNLVSVTDQAGLVSRHTYLTNPNYLEQIIDPRGKAVIRTEYDAKGRVKATKDALGNTISSDYNVSAGGSTLTQLDALGNTTTTIRDSRGNVTSVINPLGAVTQTNYDANNNPISITDSRGFSTTRTFDTRGNVSSITDALGNTRSFTYDQFNNVTSETDQLGRITRFVYNTNGNLVELIDATGQRNRFTYDNLGRVIGFADANGNATTFGYTGTTLGKPTQVTFPDGSTQQIEYNQFGQISRLVDENGNATEYISDDVGRLIIKRDALGNEIKYTYDAQLITSVIDPLGNTVKFEYDDAGRLIRQIDPFNGVTEFGYDALGRRVSETDPLGRTTTTTYREDGLITAITDGNGSTTSFEYDLAGNQTAVIDPLGNRTSFGYDALGRQIRKIDPLGNLGTYAYDAVNNLIQITDRNNRQRTFTYDGVNRLVQENWLSNSTPTRTINFTYDAVGNLARVNDVDSTFAFNYDSRDRVTQVSQTGIFGLAPVTLNYTYDGTGNRTSVSDNFGVVVNSTYDARNLLTSQTWQGTGIDPARVNYSYDSRGDRAQIQRFSDLAGTQLVGSSNFNYDALQRLTGITHSNGAGSTLANYSYNYNLASFLNSETYKGQTTNYIYDRANQLTNADRSLLPDENYTYDANGNPTGNGLVIGTNNQILSDGQFNYTYDREGNLATKTNISTGITTTYNYDFRNRLIGIVDRNTSGNITQSVEFKYDAFDRRISKTVNGQTTYFVNDGDELWAELNPAGEIISRYLQGADVDELIARYRPSEGTSWYLTDRLGTIRDMANAVGKLVNSINYDSFGEILGQTNPNLGDRFTFAGREFDSETGLYYNRARYYDANLGRFISQDPIGFGGEDANLYRYVGNNPVNATDPSGLIAAIEYGSLIKAQVLGVNGTVPGAIIGGLQGFGVTSLIFIGNILEISNRGGDIIAEWGSAIAKTRETLKDIENKLKRFESVDTPEGLVKGFISGAGVDILKISFNIPKAVKLGRELAEEIGDTKLPKPPSVTISLRSGGFNEGYTEGLKYLEALAPK
ncbi:putative Ig domain-containing protein [Nostoc sp. FACHB-87]|uniref:putative Ig domain-containing protein n=1 Tax=Nostocaceae TaxID=1162 RepID=UPI00168457EB|nr:MULTISPECIES: putative Ig domain-containing protein [Nostocaceae]MBD2459072.1 putative Ig domain-containing protein [Nostoc sp. FACHB-87]MBD2479593.1 putative Ig domain-containing protein [Anabaena sp. FACHB-83]